MANQDNLIIQLVKEKDIVIDSAEAVMLNDIESIQREIDRAIRNYLGTLDSSGGKLKADQDLAAALNRLEAEINNVLGEDYRDNVVSYLDNFDQIDKLTSDFHGDVNDITVTPEMINPVRNGLINKTVSDLSGQGLNQAFTQPVKDILGNHIVLGSTISDAQEALTNYVVGNEERLGGLNRWVSQVARDSISQYNGALDQKIATDNGIDAYRYVGSILPEDTRPQCKRWVEQGIIKIEDLDAELADSDNRGQIPGTNASNFAQLRGGYNCRHQAVPVRSSVAESIEEEVLSQDTEERVANEEEELGAE